MRDIRRTPSIISYRFPNAEHGPVIKIGWMFAASVSATFVRPVKIHRSYPVSIWLAHKHFSLCFLSVSAIFIPIAFVMTQIMDDTT